MHGGGFKNLRITIVPHFPDFDFGVDDDLHVESVPQHPLDGRQTDSQVVCVKHIELLHRLDIFLVFFRNLKYVQTHSLQ